MFPRNTAEQFLALDGDSQFKAMQGQRKYALDFILSSRYSLLDDPYKIAELTEKVFWATCVRFDPHHIVHMLRLYPYADRVMAKYGMDDRTLSVFLECISALLLGCEWSIELRNVLETQAKAIFKQLDEFNEDRNHAFVPQVVTQARQIIKTFNPDLLQGRTPKNPDNPERQTLRRAPFQRPRAPLKGADEE
jgi:hypothetical protein